MPVIPEIADRLETFAAIRRDIHAHPEIGFQEVRTSGIVVEKLKEWGIEVHTGIGGTGVVGVIEGKSPGRTVGLRADMDALPIEEETNLPWRSTVPGVSHACGHDGHTTILLAAAQRLAETRDFAGRVVLIFQPAEEGLGGARAMIADGLFEKFPCDEVYGLHNSPYTDPGVVGIKPGVAMAGADFFDIRIRGVGSHGASPQHSKDPIMVATALAQALQTIRSRNAPPHEAAVLSITQIHSGAAYNVVPSEATLSGTMRFFTDEAAERMRTRMREIAGGLAAAFGVEIEVDIRDIFTVLENDGGLSEIVAGIAAEVTDKALVKIQDEAATGSEDFADMLKAAPGVYFTVGHKGDVPLHNPAFVFDDDAIPLGASMLVKVAEARLAAG
ncbi:M20 family metallopeptidase [Albimonas sp. CAU 1670]|uniref:M20 aminoacylase family protein n=1 Tax=Albimonas sp. CAU 1670 TaxID=3032599 RepID=UPI0023DA2F49|nr:M20 aminoacylase family protein [Albimonas sp. CAU 1670]MDF2233056.1 M20 family metallopeptidase [Albimonas sp. CAU 1670]